MANKLHTRAALAVFLITGALQSHQAPVSIADAVEPGCADQSDPTPDVILCDSFEDRAFENRWSIGSNRDTWPSSQFVLCGDSFGFGDRCAAWSNYLIFDGFWGFWGYDAWRRFPPRKEFYVRWYQYISDPFIWGTLEDKSVMLHDPVGPDDPVTITAYVGTSRNHLPVEANSGPGVPFLANYQDLDWTETGGRYTKVNRFQNQGNTITLQPGRWYLFEWHIKLNTPGVSDGITRLWIDDATQPIAAQTLRLEYTDMRWLRHADAGKQFGFLRLTVYDQRCDGVPNTCPPNGSAILTQSHSWDRIVVSISPIGPIPSPPVCDSAPATPGILWPPNHQFVPVAITGVTHPLRDLVSITILEVTQDEPVHEHTDHQEDADAIIQGDHVFLRAERSGAGNGRIYEIDFAARDSRGGWCTGTVRVGVPHSLTPEVVIVDDGQIYRSTRP